MVVWYGMHAIGGRAAACIDVDHYGQSGRSLGQYVASTVHARAYTCMHGVTDTYVVSCIYISAGRHHIGIGVTPSPVIGRFLFG